MGETTDASATIRAAAATAVFPSPQPDLEPATKPRRRALTLLGIPRRRALVLSAGALLGAAAVAAVLLQSGGAAPTTRSSVQVARPRRRQPRPRRSITPS